MFSTGEAFTPDVCINFELCDLQQDIASPVNFSLAENIRLFSLFMFSYVCHESRAWDYPLLKNIMQQASPGCVFIFLDLWEHDIIKIEKTVTLALHDFSMERIGSDEFFRFNGLVVVKHA